MARGRTPHAPKAATEPKPKTHRIKVRATKTGYYDHARRREGDVFVIEEADFSDAAREPNPGWMERVPNATPESMSTAQDAIDQANADLKAARQSPAAGETI